MTRDLARLADNPFDVIVVGAGVYGLATAWDLASRGVRVALLERGDFAAATSFNSLKTIHGGIRPLQHGALREMREFVRERRTLARIAPHLVRPLPFVVPTYRHPVRNRTAMALFFAAYDVLASDRNQGVDPARALPGSRTVSRDEALALNPAIDPAGVTGGAIWHDYQLRSSERFALALLRSAVDSGACAANYTDVVGIGTAGGRVQGVRAVDRLDGGSFEVRAPVVVNAAGGGAWPLLERASLAPSRRAPRFSVAMNLVVTHPPLPHAVGGVVGGRFLFMVPWRDRSIIGTSHDEHAVAERPAERLDPDSTLVAALLRDACAAFPRAGLTPASISLVHRGLLPAGAARGTLLKRSIVHDHRADGLHGLVTVVGVRYTTARATGEVAAHQACALLERRVGPSRSADTPLAGGDIRDLDTFERDEAARSSLPAPLVARLIAAHGTRYTEVTRLFDGNPALAAPLAPGCEITGGEIVHAVRHEMAVHLADALIRRTEAGAAGHPGAAVVDAASSVMAAELGWSADRRIQEAAGVDLFYT